MNPTAEKSDDTRETFDRHVNDDATAGGADSSPAETQESGEKLKPVELVPE
jgi:hypothetical protein